MKNTIVFLLLSFFSTTADLSAQAQDPAIRITEKAIADFFAYDNAAYANAFASSGVLVNPLGMKIVSPEGIFAAHEPLFNQYWKGTTSQANILAQEVRYLQDDLAMVMLSVEFWQTKDGVEINREKAQVSGLVKNTGGDWKIELFQITPIVPVTEG